MRFAFFAGLLFALTGCRSAVCGDLQAAADHLRRVVERCDSPETQGLGEFDSGRCREHAGGCGPEELQVLKGLAACDRAIVTCASPKDASRALTDIRACAERTRTLGPACRKAIGL